MEFTYETQGANSFLVYTIGDDEQIDTLSLGMITNNKIPGLASALFTQVNDKKYVKYNISTKVSADQVFAGTVSKKQLLGTFFGIAEAMLSAEEYMIDPATIILNLKNIYVDVSTYNTSLICVPVMKESNHQEELNIFLKKIMFNTRFDETENCDYVAKIISFLNASSTMSVMNFKDLILSIKNEQYIEGNAGTSQRLDDAMHSDMVSIDKMQQIGEVNQQIPVQQSGKFNQQIPIQQPDGFDQQMPARQFGGFNQQSLAAETGKKNKKQNTKVPVIKKSAQGFAIPGAQQQPQAALQSVESQVDTGDKMSLGYLLMHYSAENKAKYKAQKESAATKELLPDNANVPLVNMKQEKKKKNKPNQQFEVPAHQTGGLNGQAPLHQTGGLNGQVPLHQAGELNRQMPEHQLQNGLMGDFAQHKPSINFGETTVLNAGNIGETTVLNANMFVQSNPHLIRRRSNEQIEIDKPIFRIGKEKSYVDYFIGDNPAISRSHANIITKEGKYYIVDTNSTNHTYIEGKMIPCNQETELHSGNVIKLANEEFEFHL